MNYQKELIHLNDIECYWESHEMGTKTEYVYPSLPEPYINIFFPLKEEFKPTIKGISWKADYFKVNSKLFGICLKLRGFLQLKLIKSIIISNKIVNFHSIGGSEEEQLTKAILNSTSFEDRIKAFNDYYEKKRTTSLTKNEQNISDAFTYLFKTYEDPNVIENYAKLKLLSTRTINRWFTNDIGISPKKLSRVMRFHNTLFALHSYKENGFYIDYGYYDQAHFIREFKEFTGRSPESYLKMVSDLYNE